MAQCYSQMVHFSSKFLSSKCLACNCSGRFCPYMELAATVECCHQGMFIYIFCLFFYMVLSSQLCDAWSAFFFNIFTKLQLPRHIAYILVISYHNYQTQFSWLFHFFFFHTFLSVPAILKGHWPQLINKRGQKNTAVLNSQSIRTPPTCSSWSRV